MSVELGQEARDIVTGFTGVITGKAEYLTGCVQFSITPRVDKDGKCQDNVWFDEARLVRVEGSIDIKIIESPAINPGGPQDSPSKG